MLQNVLKLADYYFHFPIAHAHCDVPCGIYDPHDMQLAAKTVHKMVEKINALPKEKSLNDKNNFVRMVETKEAHAQKCKQELLILWTDYFKLEHVEMFPNLHETFWKAAKLCSKNKQNVDEEAANELVAITNEIAKMFHEAEAAKKK